MSRKTQAALAVAQTHEISPGDCFVRFINAKEGWGPIPGTGCAHYVAHRLGIRRGTVGNTACDLGYTIRVPLLLQGMQPVDPKNVRENDVWANIALTHCGIVTLVVSSTGLGGSQPTITITHCASNQTAGRLGPTVSDWATFFRRGGSFYRPQ
jgi:hypothetical protein